MTTDPTSEGPRKDEPDLPAESGSADPPDAARPSPESHEFQHPQWMIGVVLILAVLALFAGLDNPVWWLIGSPCILVLIVYVWVRFRI